MRRYLIKCWLTLLLCAATGFAQAQQPHLIIVRSDASSAYQQASQSLVQTLTRKGVPVDTVQELALTEYGAPQRSAGLKSAQLVVTLGVAATEALLSDPASPPVLAGLIPRLSFDRLLQSRGRQAQPRVSAIYFDQPLTRQLALLQLAFPQARQVGVLLGPQSGTRLSALRQGAAPLNLSTRLASVASDQDLYGALRHVLEGSDVLLALADPLVYNSGNLQNILLTSYRAHVPMLAFSPAYVRAGATLALFTDPAQAGQQAAEVALAVLRGGKWPETALEPDDFRVDVNANVARSLGLSLDAESLRLRLQALERVR